MQVPWSYITSWTCRLWPPEFPFMLLHGALRFWRRSAKSAVGKSVLWQTNSESYRRNHCLEAVSVRKHYELRREGLVRQHHFMFWHEHPSQNLARFHLAGWKFFFRKRTFRRKTEITTGSAHFLIHVQNLPCRVRKLTQLHIAYFHATNFILIRKSECVRLIPKERHYWCLTTLA